jgi:hypothetical protein
MRWNKESIAPDFGEIIAQRIHDLKEAAKANNEPITPFTQRVIAEKIGMASGASVGYITRGKRITLIRPAQFWKLGKVLGLTPDEMLEAAGYLDVPKTSKGKHK